MAKKGKTSDQIKKVEGTEVKDGQKQGGEGGLMVEPRKVNWEPSSGRRSGHPCFC